MKLYYSISEVAEMLGVSQSLLRYWETEFSELKPSKNARGVRMYKQEDIDLLRRIHHLTKSPSKAHASNYAPPMTQTTCR